jgi:hypothetical protein
VKYFIDYQYMPKDAARPKDDGEVIPILATDKSGTVILPNVGDYVEVQVKAGAKFSGKVRSRLFRYIGDDNDRSAEPLCMVNIVVAQTADDWGRLVKEGTVTNGVANPALTS